LFRAGDRPAGPLHTLVKAEQRRGNLPTVLPVGTVAIDGKNVASWHDLCRYRARRGTGLVDSVSRS
jgi:hypothetical protein